MSHTHYTKSIHGEVKRGVYHKTVTGSIHRLKRPPAWAVDVSDLAEAERRGATRIEIHDLESGIIYASSVENFRAHSLRVNRGYGAQLALELRHWGTISNLRSGVDTAKPGETLPRPPKQLGLFEGVRHV